MKLKDRLKELRGTQSQQQFLNDFNERYNLDIKQTRYSLWERGGEPSIDILIKLADYYDVTLDYLMGRVDYIQPEYRQVNIDTGLTEAAIRGIQKIRDESTEADNKIAVLNYLLELENTTYCANYVKFSHMLYLVGTHNKKRYLEEMINKQTLSEADRKELLILAKIGLESSIECSIEMMAVDWINMYERRNKTTDLC